MKNIVCISMVTDKNWKWFKDKISNKEYYNWVFFKPFKKNYIEKLIKHPDLSKLKACYTAACAMKGTKNKILVSHLPTYSVLTEFFMGKKKRETYHLAFSFNFTELPTGLKRIFMKNQFKKIDKFTVYSNFERELYSKYFDIPIEKIDFIHLGLGVPKVTQDRIIKNEYICAIGGEGRDYKTLIETAKEMEGTNFVIVTRPKNLKGLEIPNNVKIKCDIPIEDVFNIMKYSKFAIVPLLHTEVPCGHITMVFAMHLGKAQIVSDSEGVMDYIKKEYNGLFYKAGDSKDLESKIKDLLENEENCLKFENNAQNFASEYCSEEKNVQYFEKILDEINTCGES